VGTANRPSTSLPSVARGDVVLSFVAGTAAGTAEKDAVELGACPVYG
jgi:hypothetical protein